MKPPGKICAECSWGGEGVLGLNLAVQEGLSEKGRVKAKSEGCTVFGQMKD